MHYLLCTHRDGCFRTGGVCTASFYRMKNIHERSIGKLARNNSYALLSICEQLENEFYTTSTPKIVSIEHFDSVCEAVEG